MRSSKMLLKHSTILISIIFITVNLRQTGATKCGGYLCEGASECKVSTLVQGKLECTCEEGFVANITGNVYYCYQPTASNDEGKCLKIGDKCGPDHTCNQNLMCEKTHAENEETAGDGFVDCTASEKKCVDRCCHAGESCMQGKCVLNPSIEHIECPALLKCGDKCCAETELCSKEKICILRSYQNESVAVGQCLDSQKCADKCCNENEVCKSGNKCVTKTPQTEQCPETQKCQNNCCKVNELCVHNSICIAIRSPDIECPQEKICLDKCCKDTEKCNLENVCVAKQQLDNENALECPGSQKCSNFCCAENEICSAGNKCVARALLSLECPESQKCRENCCTATQICSADFKCVNVLKTSFTEAAFSTLSSIFPVDCPLEKQCLVTCCRPEEKCSKFNACIPINTIECIETEICGDKCCPINETCNEHHECVAFIEVETIGNCPLRQQCLGGCCEPHEVCNEKNVCVPRILKKELFSEDILPPSATESSFDATVHLVDLITNEQPTNCAENYFVCQSKCCSHKQICSSAGECEDKTEENVATADCESEQNCAENARITDAKASLAYTIIGLSSLVMVLSFALFKVYAFRRSSRIVY